MPDSIILEYTRTLKCHLDRDYKVLAPGLAKQSIVVIDHYEKDLQSDSFIAWKGAFDNYRCIPLEILAGTYLCSGYDHKENARVYHVFSDILNSNIMSPVNVAAMMKIYKTSCEPALSDSEIIKRLSNPVTLHKDLELFRKSEPEKQTQG